MISANQSIELGLAELGNDFRQGFLSAKTEQALRVEYAKVLGKKGSLTAVLAKLKDVADLERPAIGVKVNAFKKSVEDALQERLHQLEMEMLDVELNVRQVDLSLPCRLQLGRGHAHPLHLIKEELLEIFRDLGFSFVEGPEIESEENNFTKLAFPPDHPATDMQDSFWVGPELLLRTHTSTVQSREMSMRTPPMAIVSAGAVYRRDDDMTHSPMFHQIDGFLVDEKVSLSDLKGVLTTFLQTLYGSSTKVRFRPSYFPFVEPGAEVDIGCVFCLKEDGSHSGCRVCKHTGWIEILGCGMIHPTVFEKCNIDSEKYTGFAFGLGIERVAMLRYGVPNIRLFYENDPRFLKQF